ncbi:MAG: family 78 glycoside hydrolase catalytic domain [Haloarculaceae archaeon]
MAETSNASISSMVNFEEKPNNVPGDEVRFSWHVEGPGGDRQTAYRIVVGRDRAAVAAGSGDTWDTGTVSSDRNVDVPYGGAPLASDTTYYWLVHVWDEDGTHHAMEAPASFTTALNGEADWTGEWIGHQPGPGDSSGYRSQWRAADEDAIEWVQIDLGEERSIEGIDLHPAAPFSGLRTPDGFVVTPLYAGGDRNGYLETVEKVAGFGFPERYRIAVADDPSFESAQVVVDRTGEQQPNPGGEARSFDVDASGRYVRITATACDEFDPAVAPQLDVREFGGTANVQPDRIREEATPWQVFALGGVRVFEDERDVARDRSVTASSSVETATWGRERLVDGVPGSERASQSPLLRTSFDLSKPVAAARVHVSTLGFGELYLNGTKVGDAELDPGWTAYDETVPYATHDVGDLLEPGHNAIGVWLGRGFFGRSELNWTGFGSPRARVQLLVEYEDGTTRRIDSDSSWRAVESPIGRNDVYDGERYDARDERPGWATADYDDGDWSFASVLDHPGGTPRPRRVQPVEVTETFAPTDVREHGDGYTIEFPQNLTGWLKIEIDDPPAGREITLRHAEALDEDGDLLTVDLRSADATDSYVTKGADAETYAPRFTYHGFKYAHVSGYPGELSAEDVEAQVVHTSMERDGTFDCSNDDLAAVQHSAEWSLRGNAVAIPTGCAQRGERTGWTGDAHLSARALLFNFDAPRFHEKWLRDHADDQSRHGYLSDTIPHATGRRPADPAWAVTQVFIPWNLYQHYGDRHVLEAHYDGMRRYVEYWRSVADEDGLITGEYGYYGDWLAFEERAAEDDRVGEPRELFNTAFHYRTVDRLATIAGELGNEADADRFGEMADEIAAGFNDRFLDRETATYEPGSQAAQAVPLHFGLVPDGLESRVAATLARTVRDDGTRLMTGFLGTPALIHSLADNGYEELAYEVVSQPEQPGWVYMVNNGPVTTTLWERWDSDTQIDSGMNSFNHHQFAYVSEWFYERLAGIRIADTGPGVRQVAIEPIVVDDLDWAEGTLDTPNGTLASRWERDGDAFTMDVTVPWNATAAIHVPAEGDATVTVDDTTVWEDGRAPAALPDGVPEVERTDDAVVVHVGAGSVTLRRTERD